MKQDTKWVDHPDIGVTVTDFKGIIVSMNKAACQTFKGDGGARLLGSNLFDCHPEPSKSKLRKLYEEKRPNHYFITSKTGQAKIIHQIPWYNQEKFAGFVEISIPLPRTNLPHFDRRKSEVEKNG